VEAPPRNLSTEVTHAERKWATGNSVNDYIEQRWRLASDPALLARFRSRNANFLEDDFSRYSDRHDVFSGPHAIQIQALLFHYLPSGKNLVSFQPSYIC